MSQNIDRVVYSQIMLASLFRFTLKNTHHTLVETIREFDTQHPSGRDSIIISFVLIYSIVYVTFTGLLSRLTGGFLVYF